MGTDDGVLREYAGLSDDELDEVLGIGAGTDVSELQVAFGSARVTVRREPGVLSTPSRGPVQPEAGAAHAAADAPLAITSPLVGIFRPAVRPGDHVSVGQSLGAIEALGMPTSVDAPRGGLVDEVLVVDGSPVEYGQPLLVLRRADRLSRS